MLRLDHWINSTNRFRLRHHCQANAMAQFCSRHHTVARDKKPWQYRSDEQFFVNPLKQYHHNTSSKFQPLSPRTINFSNGLIAQCKLWDMMLVNTIHHLVQAQLREYLRIVIAHRYHESIHISWQISSTLLNESLLQDLRWYLTVQFFQSLTASSFLASGD